MRVAQAIEISEQDRRTLQRWSRGRSVPARLVLRGKDRAAGRRRPVEQRHRVRTQHRDEDCLRFWRNRFAKSGLAGIEKDAPRGGRPGTSRAAIAEKIIRKTTTEKPAAATQWSTRTLAAHLGTSPTMVQRVWKANRLQPHRTKTFKLLATIRTLPTNFAMSWVCI